MLTIHKCNLDKEAIKYLEVIKHYFEQEIKYIKAGCKKTYTPNQLTKIYESLFNRISIKIHERQLLNKNKNKRKRVYIIYNERLARDYNIKVIRAYDSDEALEYARITLEDEYHGDRSVTCILNCTDTGIEIND
jgi:hypothetical protein